MSRVGLPSSGCSSVDHLAGDVGDGDQPGAHRRRGDQEHHHRARLRRRHEDVIELLQAQLAIDERGDQDRVHRGDDRGLGGREEPELQAEDDDERQHQRPDRLAQGAQHLDGRAPRRRRDAFRAGDEPPRNPERRAHHQAREDAGEEQLRDRDVGGDAEHHEADARRNDRRDDAGRGDQAGRARLVVARGHHHRQEQRRERGRVGHRGARERREQAGGDDRHVAEAAAHVADEGEREVDDPLRQAADVHDLAGEDEERRGEQREAVGAVDDVLRQDLRIEHLQLPHQGDARGEQRERDRDAEQHRRDQRQDEDGQRHSRPSTPGSSATGGSPASAAQQVDDVVQQNGRGRDGEDDAAAVEDAHRKRRSTAPRRSS